MKWNETVGKYPGVRMSKVGFCKHGRDTTKRLTKYNTFGSVLNFGGCVINMNTFQSTVMNLCGCKSPWSNQIRLIVTGGILDHE